MPNQLELGRVFDAVVAALSGMKVGLQGGGGARQDGLVAWDLPVEALSSLKKSKALPLVTLTS